MDLLFDALIIPLYYYILGYLAVFVLALIISRLGSDEARLGSYESASHLGWLLGFIFHVVAGVALIGYYPVYRGLEQSVGWQGITVYVLLYGLFMIVDFVCLIFLIKRRSKGKS